MRWLAWPHTCLVRALGACGEANHWQNARCCFADLANVSAGFAAPTEGPHGTWVRRYRAQVGGGGAPSPNLAPLVQRRSSARPGFCLHGEPRCVRGKPSGRSLIDHHSPNPNRVPDVNRPSRGLAPRRAWPRRRARTTILRRARPRPWRGRRKRSVSHGTTSVKKTMER